MRGRDERFGVLEHVGDECWYVPRVGAAGEVQVVRGVEEELRAALSTDDGAAHPVGITDPFQNRAGGVPPVHLLEGCVERMFVRHVRFAKAKNRVAIRVWKSTNCNNFGGNVYNSNLKKDGQSPEQNDDLRRKTLNHVKNGRP